jgi:demethylmenaquinone methyltransferase / 2-methoxy-6-polyprenyl-1,4-benzoquinol methylase
MTTAAKTLKLKKTASFYDRIADVHNLALKLNGYRDSVAKFLRSLRLEIDGDSMVLDAGSGTGIVTLAFHEAGFRPAKTVAFDLSGNSLQIAMEQAGKEPFADSRNIVPVQGNILKMPFADGTFDLVLSCGVLEYVPLEDGLSEIARVMKKGGKLVLLPVKPSLVGSVLELLYNFKLHPLENVRRTSERYFKIVDELEFPIAEPISWSKAIFLLERK